MTSTCSMTISMSSWRSRRRKESWRITITVRTTRRTILPRSCPMSLRSSACLRSGTSFPFAPWAEAATEWQSSVWRTLKAAGTAAARPPFPTSPARRRKRRSLRRSSTSSKIPGNSSTSARASPRACCSSALRVRAKRCSPVRSPAKRAWSFCRSPALISLRCMSAWAHPACAICLNRQRRSRLPSSLSTRSMRSDVSAAPVSAADTMSASRPSTSFWSRWTASARIRASW